MANFDKWGRGGAGHLLKHFERAQELNKETGEMEYVKFGNRDIDPSRTHLNYNLAPERPEGQYNFIKQRCSEVYCLGRKDVNVLCSWIVTAPETLDPSKENEFFRASYQTLADNYGEENVVSAYVHKDESGRSHMHFAFIPIVYDEKKDRFTVNAKKCVTRTDLRNFHPWLEAELEQRLGYHVDVINEATKDGNKTVSQLKQERELAKQQEAAEKTAEALKERQKVETEVETLKGEKNALEADLEPLREVTTDIRDLDEKHAPIKTSWGGGKVTYKAEDAQFLKDAAAYSYKAAYEKRDYQRYYENEKNRHALTKDALKREREKASGLEQENGELKQENKLMAEFIKNSGDGLWDRFQAWRRQRLLVKQQERERKRTLGRSGQSK